MNKYSNIKQPKIYVGPDISVHNGKPDFNIIRDKFDFVILRCGYGGNYPNQEDAAFERNSSECERLGIPYGVYIYSYAKDVKSAIDEAEHCLYLIKNKLISCGVWYDLEDSSLPQDKTVLTDIALNFVNEIEKKAYSAGIYSSLSWFNSRFDNRISPLNKWVAQWNNNFDYNGNSVMWQYSSDDEICGLDGKFDMNAADERIFDFSSSTVYKAKNAVDSVEKYIVTAKSGLNIRRRADINSEITGVFSYGDIVKAEKGKAVKNGRTWVKLLCGGYCAKEYLEKAENNFGLYIVNVQDGLNLRKYPSLDSYIYKAVPKGTELFYTATYNGWAKGAEGWFCLI